MPVSSAKSPGKFLLFTEPQPVIEHPTDKVLCRQVSPGLWIGFPKWRDPVPILKSEITREGKCRLGDKASFTVQVTQQKTIIAVDTVPVRCTLVILAIVIIKHKC